MQKGKAYIGTSGWSYKDWKGRYYPEKMKTAEWLTYYAEQFPVTEINTSFYHLPKPQTVLNWAAKVPDNFRFCPKISRYITHMKKLLEPEEPLQRFFDVFDTIKHHTGPVLVQLPPSVKYDSERTTHFFSILRDRYSDYDFVLEVRHNTWLDKEPLALMKEYGIGFVISQSGVGFPYSETVTAQNIYVRFHGPEQLYASSYSNEALEEFARKFQKWMKKGHTVWAFFNNDINGHAVSNATYLKSLMDKG